MDDAQYGVFRRFSDQDEAESFTIDLKARGFRAEYVLNAPVQDPLFVGNGMVRYLVTLPTDEFERAEKLLLEEAGSNMDEIPADHYLHDFNDRELMEVLVKPDEWSADDVVMAEHLLRERGMPVSSDAVDIMREARLSDLRKEAPPQTPFIVVGYIAALLGGLIAVAIGWYINTAKRTLPNGERVYVYRASDRRHAARIFSLGILIFLGWFALRLWSMFKS